MYKFNKENDQFKEILDILKEKTASRSHNDASSKTTTNTN